MNIAKLLKRLLTKNTAGYFVFPLDDEIWKNMVIIIIMRSSIARLLKKVLFLVNVIELFIWEAA